MLKISNPIESAIATLVYAFYKKVRADRQLGPIFNHHITDWDEHHTLLIDFWSSVLTGSQRFSGSPMMKHAALPELNAELFKHWLAIFHQTCLEQDNQEIATQAFEAAQRIAQSLWYGYQLRKNPDSVPEKLNVVIS